VFIYCLLTKAVSSDKWWGG